LALGHGEERRDESEITIHGDNRADSLSRSKGCWSWPFIHPVAFNFQFRFGCGERELEDCWLIGNTGTIARAAGIEISNGGEVTCLNCKTVRSLFDS
jgi:hypothetical protein